MPRYTLDVNGESMAVDVAADVPLLWVLRDVLGLTGTKYGCGVGQCGACTVHVDGAAIRSCSMPVSRVQGAITTIEGLGGRHPLQRAWVEHDVPQCGYCQPGQIMNAAALLSERPDADENQIRTAMSGNLCRCGTYPRILAAIRSVADDG